MEMLKTSQRTLSNDLITNIRSEREAAHNCKRNFNESEMKEKARRKSGLAMIGQTKLKVNLAAMNMLQALECTTNKLTYIRCVIQVVVR